MKELRRMRQFLRLAQEEKDQELKIEFLSRIFLESKKAGKKINKENLVRENLLKKARNEIENL